MPTKIAIVTPMFGRHGVFEAFIRGVNALNFPDVEIIPCISGSEGKVSRDLVGKIKNSRYVEVRNNPLCQKTNAAMRLGGDCDYFFNMGSDDIFHPEAFRKYIDIINAEHFDFVGVLDFYFIDVISKRSLYWGGYREKYRIGYTCGAGRMISKALVEHYDYNIFECDKRGNLDHSMQEKIDGYAGKNKTFYLKDFDLYAIDIKSEVNMTPFEFWDNTTEIDSKIIKQKFAYLWK
jgi:hypothetical protein